MLYHQDLTREELRAGLDASLPTFAGCLAMDCRKAGNAHVVRLRDVSLFLLLVLAVGWLWCGRPNGVILKTKKITRAMSYLDEARGVDDRC